MKNKSFQIMQEGFIIEERWLLVHLKMKQNEFEDEYKNNIRDKNGLINYKKLNRLISFKKRDLSDDLIRKHLQVHNLCTLFKKMFALRNKKENNNVTIVIKANRRI